MSELASKIYPYLFRYRYRFAVGAVFLVLTTAINLIAPWVLKLAIDHLTPHMGLTGIDAVPNGPALGFYAGSLVGIAIGGGLCRFFMRRIIIGASREIERDLRNDFFSHLQRLPLVYFQANRTGDLMSRATNDLAAVRMMVGPAIMYSATTMITFVVALGLMLSISPSLTLYALIPLPIVSVVVKWFGSAIYRRSEKIQEQLAALSAIVQEALAGVRVVRAYRREQIEIERFRVANDEYVARSRALVQLQGAFHPSLALFLGLSGLVVLWMGSQYVIAGQMTIGEFVAFNAYVVMLSWPMIAFGWVTNMLQRGMAAWQRMLNVFEVVPSIRDSAAVRSGSGTGVGGVRGAVEFRNLTFAYNGRDVLSNVSAAVQPGQMLALVGPTGSGKSTLVELIPRLFDPPPGTVFVDGMDVRDMPLNELRRAIGYVSQEPFLFSDTLRENISFGALSAVRDETIQSVVRLSRLEADIDQFPKGFEVAVGERGITLSGGQKQRVAIARALLPDPRILILDDALSAVDTQTEEEILSGLRGVMRDRTSIVVAHRISTIRAADLILVLDDGCVVERGTHDQLVAGDGLYNSLYRKQLLQQALEES
ncbi:MAG: ABC transporter ATP-binding protein [Acidobacteriota bacterium]|nr:ABC transporter ATP-binding protein [Acidobacteriota bacterium]